MLTVKKIFSILAALALMLPSAVLGAQNAGLVNGIWFSQENIVEGQVVRIFAVVQNETSETLKGTVTFFADKVSIGTVDVSLAPSSIDRVEVEHTFENGTRAVSTGFSTGTVAELSRTVFVDRDTDADGIGNIEDTDDDNDGIADEDDDEPLVKNKPKKPESALSSTLETVRLATSTEAILDTLFGTSTKATSTGARVAQGARAAAGGTLNAFQSLDVARERVAENVKAYEEEQRQKIDTINRAAVEGFQAPAEEAVPPADEKTSTQIAAAGAAVIGSILEHELLFYAHILLLLIGIWHLIWRYLKRKYRAQY